jgi:predicted short-subunit dehydrogenase-like oxidoreductase (DUF2520 family)
VFALQDVFNRTLASTQAAVAFIGAGRDCALMTAMRAAEVWLIAIPDSGIMAAAQALAQSQLLRVGDVVFHASGALASDALRTAMMGGEPSAGGSGSSVSVASVHPLKSFANPADAVRTFAGTHCTAEGDAVALALLTPAFERIGARFTAIDPQCKTLYHAASVLVCNDLTALMEAGLQCFEQAGIPRATASAMMEPLVRETVDNVFKLGTVKALTGPVARGDVAVVERQLTALRAFDPRIAEIYRALAVMAVGLVRARTGNDGGADAAALVELERLLGTVEGRTVPGGGRVGKA